MNARYEVILRHQLEQFAPVFLKFLPRSNIIEQRRSHNPRIFR